MYLIDTNIFLEILLDQERSDECEKLLKKAKTSEDFYASSFTLHSIEVIMARNDKTEELKQFLQDIRDNNITRLETNTSDEIKVIDTMKEQDLDFDDAMQYYTCDKHDLNIISFDNHFDTGDIERLEPKDID